VVTQVVKKFNGFIDTESSLPYAKQPAIELCREILKSNSHLRKLLLYDQF